MFLAWLLKLAVYAVFTAFILTVGLALLAQVDWAFVVSRLVLAGVILVLLYFGSQLLPGPVQQVGRSGVRQLQRGLKSVLKAVSRRSDARRK